MKLLFGVEMSEPIKDKAPGYYAQLVKKTAELCPLFDRDKYMMIVKSKSQQQALASFYAERNLLQEKFDLILIETPETKAPFSDYGFFSDSNRAYLYAPLVKAYHITNFQAVEEKNMGMIQLEEHLISIESKDEKDSLYFVDKHHTALIDKIADAYHMTIEWQCL